LRVRASVHELCLGITLDISAMCMYLYVRRGRLDVQLRVPCRRDVIFSCCNCSLAGELRAAEFSCEGRGGREVVVYEVYLSRARAPLLFHGRERKAKRTRKVRRCTRARARVCVCCVCVCLKQTKTALSLSFFLSFTELVSYIFHVPIYTLVCIIYVCWCPSKEFYRSREKCFYSIFPVSLTCSLQPQKERIVYFCIMRNN